MVLMNESDIAWEKFSKDTESFSRSSLIDKLDALSSQMNELQTTSSRLASIVPQLMGDSAALDAADSAPAPPADDMAGMGLGDQSAEPMPPLGTADDSAGGDMSADEDKQKDIEAGAEDHPVDETMPEPPSEDKGAELPASEGTEPPAPPVDEAPVEGAPADGVPPEGAPADAMSEQGGFEYNSDVAFEDFVSTLSEEIHDAVDAGDLDKAEMLMAKLRAVQTAWGGAEGMPMDALPAPPMEAPVEAGAPAPENLAPPQIPPAPEDLEAVRKNDDCCDGVEKAEGEMDVSDTSGDADSVVKNEDGEECEESVEKADDEDEDDDDDDDDDDEKEDDKPSFIKSEFSASSIFDQFCTSNYGAPVVSTEASVSEPVAKSDAVETVEGKVLEGFEGFVKNDRPPSYSGAGSDPSYVPAQYPQTQSIQKNDTQSEMTLENMTKGDWEMLENHFLYKSQ